jgi:hypothetical protein
MARPHRIEFLGAIYHVTSRDNARRKVFQDDANREAFLATLTTGRSQDLQCNIFLVLKAPPSHAAIL